MKILIVEDHQSLVANLYAYLEPRGHLLDAAPDGLTGLQLAINNDYDVLVVDWMLPRLDGPTLVRRLRREAGKLTPVLLLTARSELADKAAGFGAGADDYLSKPFAMLELELRLTALTARYRGQIEAAQRLRYADLELDLQTLEARRDGQLLRLYPACRKLLEALLRSAPAVVSREQLESALWGDSPPDADLLRSHLYELRRVVDGNHAEKRIHTVPRVGYRIT